MESVLVESRVPVATFGLVRRALMPLVWIKNVLSRLHVWLLSMLWDELIRGKTTGDNVGNVVAAVAFLGLSLFVYHYQEGLAYGVLALCVVWGLDFAWVRWGRDATQRGAKITLSTAGEQIFWRRTDASADEQIVTLNREELSGVAINRLRAERGLLQAVWRTEWQVYLTRRDHRGEPLLVSVGPNLSNAYKLAMRLGDTLELPISFVGESPEVRKATPKATPGSTLAHSPGGRKGTAISTRVSVAALRRLLGSVLAESGLLLFLLVLTAVMAWLGQIVHFYVVPLLGLGSTTMRINLSLGGLIGIFRPDVDWKDMLEITIAMAVVLLTGLRYCRRHTLRFTETTVEYFRGRRRKTTLRRAQVRQLHYVAAPYPLLVFSDGHDVVAIDLPAPRKDFAAFHAAARDHLDRA